MGLVDSERIKLTANLLNALGGVIVAGATEVDIVTWFQFFAFYISPALVLLVGHGIYKATEPRRHTPAE
jgi:hypothetical protein